MVVIDAILAKVIKKKRELALSAFTWIINEVNAHIDKMVPVSEAMSISQLDALCKDFTAKNKVLKAFACGGDEESCVLTELR